MFFFHPECVHVKLWVVASFCFLTWFKFVSLFIWEKWPLAFPFCFVYAKHVIVIHQSQTSMKSPSTLLASNWELLQFLSIAGWMNMKPDKSSDIPNYQISVNTGLWLPAYNQPWVSAFFDPVIIYCCNIWDVLWSVSHIGVFMIWPI